MTAQNVTRIYPRRMTEEEYERERAALRQTYGDTDDSAKAKRAQALALLFARSNWTQQELAEQETKIRGKKVSQPYISQLLTFGRFLEFIADAINSDYLPKNLTEGKFRSYWERTEESNERLTPAEREKKRFAQVQKLMVIEGNASQEVTGDGVYAAFRRPTLHSFIRFVGEILNIKVPELARAHVIAAMYATFIINEDESRRFWNDVSRGGVQYDDTSPSTILDKWLVAAKDKESKEKLKLKPGNFYQGCIYAWNAFREEKPLKDIKSDTKKGWLNVVA